VDTGWLLARLAERPAEAAVLLDVDGTLAPIAPRPEDAVVPDETRRILRQLVDRYALVACISGRVGDEAAALVGVGGVVGVGEHGLELDPRAAEWATRIREFAESVEWPAERKRLTAAFHWRSSDDERSAVTELRAVADRAIA